MVSNSTNIARPQFQNAMFSLFVLLLIFKLDFFGKVEIELMMCRKQNQQEQSSCRYFCLFVWLLACSSFTLFGLFICVSVCCLSICAPVCLFIYLCFCLLLVYLCSCLFVCQSVLLFVCWSICVSICLYVCLSVFHFIGLSVFVSVCLYVYLLYFHMLVCFCFILFVFLLFLFPNVCMTVFPFA